MDATIKEDLLYYLWQYQYFDKQNLTTTDGEFLEIIKLGYRNNQLGPDFLDAKIKIGDIEWCGNVEIHVKTSDWNLHNHTNNKLYDTVVLHLVFDHDQENIRRPDKSLMPVLELKNIINQSILDQYLYFKSNIEVIPCANQFANVKNLQKYLMIDQAQTLRLQRKSELVYKQLQEFEQDWEQTTFSLVAQSLGMKNNQEPMLELSKIAPIEIIRRTAENQFQTEALLLGQAGLIKVTDDYSQKLKDEHQHLSIKFRLKLPMEAQSWQYARLRPASNPILRLVQLSLIYSKSQYLFSSIIELESIEDIKKLFEINYHEYWLSHYDFGKISKSKTPILGQDTINLLLINVVSLVLVSFSSFIDNQSFTDKAVELLQNIKPEVNYITKTWKSLGLEPQNAFESQGLIELHQQFCMKKNCLSCTIGIDILQKNN